MVEPGEVPPGVGDHPLGLVVGVDAPGGEYLPRVVEIQRRRDHVELAERRAVEVVQRVGRQRAQAMGTGAPVIVTDAPGLGVLVLRGIRNLEIGVGIVAGLGIVLLAVMLDRASKAALARVDVSGQRR